MRVRVRVCGGGARTGMRLEQIASRPCPRWWDTPTLCGMWLLLPHRGLWMGTSLPGFTRRQPMALCECGWHRVACVRYRHSSPSQPFVHNRCLYVCNTASPLHQVWRCDTVLDRHDGASRAARSVAALCSRVAAWWWVVGRGEQSSLHASCRTLRLQPRCLWERIMEICSA